MKIRKSTPSPTPSPSKGASSSRTSRPNTTTPSAPASSSSTNKARRDDFDTGAAKTRSRRPQNTEEVGGSKAGGSKKMSNSEVRKAYLEKVGTIPELDKKWKAEGVPAEERARRAVAIRHEARVETRKMMGNPLERALLKARDFFKYGRLDGPSFDQLVKQAKAKGLQGDAVYESLIKSSNRTNQTVNQHFVGNTGSNS